MNIGSFFTLKKRKRTLAVIFDVGSASVGAALVLLSTNKTPKIVYVVRRQMPVLKEVDIKRFIASMSKTFDLVMDDMQKKGMAHLKFTHLGTSHPEMVHCFFSSPWNASQIRNITIEGKKSHSATPDDLESFSVTDKILSKIIEKEVLSVQRAESDSYEKKGIVNEGVKLIEKKIINLKLNGYNVNKVHGQMAKRVEALLFVSFVPREITDLVSKKVQHFFSLKNIHFHSFTLSFFSAMRDIWNREENFLLVDVSGEVTEVSLVKDSKISQMISFPMGRNSYIRAIAKKLKVSMSEASSFINMHASGMGSEAKTRQIQSIQDSIEEKWYKNFKEVLNDLSEGVFLPRLVFLTASEPYGEWISDIITGKKETLLENSTTSAFTQEPFIVNRITSKKLSYFVRFVRRVTKDPFLIVEALFISKL